MPHHFCTPPLNNQEALRFKPLDINNTSSHSTKSVWSKLPTHQSAVSACVSSDQKTSSSSRRQTAMTSSQLSKSGAYVLHDGMHPSFVDCPHAVGLAAASATEEPWRGRFICHRDMAIRRACLANSLQGTRAACKDATVADLVSLRLEALEPSRLCAQWFHAGSLFD